MESKELMIRKKNYGYHILVAVLIISVFASVAYFSNAKNDDNEKNSNDENDGRVISYSGENSGEIIFANENLIEGTERNNPTSQKEDTKIPSEIVKSQTENKIEQEEKIEEKLGEKLGEKFINSSDVEIGNYYASNRKLDKDKPMVALTFDDGPDPNRTLKIIEILKKYNARATFFDIGNLIDKYPETAKAEVDSGCDVGGHTYTHSNLNSLSKEEIIDEITKLEKAFQKATGQELKYIRPTYGNANSLVQETVKHPLINWCVDSLDWKSRDTDKILEEIYQTKDFDGKIIIMHVIYDTTVEAVKKLVPDLINKGYQLVTISEMAEYKGYTLENGKVYYQF